MDNSVREGLVSIIIPVYNSGRYLQKMFESIFSQSYSNYEVIVAYDVKSTDNSLELLQKINETHPIIIDVGEDASIGGGRNRGFGLAKGEFVIFVDADDEMMSDYLESLVKIFLLDSEIDVVCCNPLLSSEKDVESRKMKSAEHKSDYVKIYNQSTAVMLHAKWILSRGTWAYMSRRQYLTEHSITWPEYSVREDWVFSLRLLSHAIKVGHSTRPGYIYIQHPTSAVHSDFAKLYDLLEISRRDLLELYESLSPSAKNEWYIREMQTIAYGLACKYRYTSFRQKLLDKDILKLYIFPENSAINKISSHIFNISKPLYYFCSRIVNVRRNNLPFRRIWVND